jgi:hypothetical protein
MKRSTARAVQLAACLFGWGVLTLAAPPGRAQSGAAEPATPAAGPAYQDR